MGFWRTLIELLLLRESAAQRERQQQELYDKLLHEQKVEQEKAHRRLLVERVSRGSRSLASESYEAAYDCFRDMLEEMELPQGDFTPVFPVRTWWKMPTRKDVLLGLGVAAIGKGNAKEADIVLTEAGYPGWYSGYEMERFLEQAAIHLMKLSYSREIKAIQEGSKTTQEGLDAIQENIAILKRYLCRGSFVGLFLDDLAECCYDLGMKAAKAGYGEVGVFYLDEAVKASEAAKYRVFNALVIDLPFFEAVPRGDYEQAEWFVSRVRERPDFYADSIYLLDSGRIYYNCVEYRLCRTYAGLAKRATGGEGDVKDWSWAEFFYRRAMDFYPQLIEHAPDEGRKKSYAQYMHELYTLLKKRAAGDGVELAIPPPSVENEL